MRLTGRALFYMVSLTRSERSRTGLCCGLTFEARPDMVGDLSLAVRGVGHWGGRGGAHLCGCTPARLISEARKGVEPQRKTYPFSWIAERLH